RESGPHTNKALGSNLDGDLYFVTYDEHLIPPSKQSWPPMEYTAVEAKELPRETTSKQIYLWMGKFSNRNIAKCAARMGQCFSSTYATVEVPRHEVDLELKDTFSHGMGKMSPKLAVEVAEKL
nr:RNA-dependent RNA polymerase 6 [Tanacetum cinerariifolium]